MKQFATSFAASLLAGIVLVSLIFAGVVIYGYWDSGYSNAANDQSDSNYVADPPGLRITQHEKVDGVALFTVRGIVENTSKNTWFAVEIAVSPHVGEAQIGQCAGAIYGKFLPGARRAFQVECEHTSTKLPDPISYGIKVRSARKG